MERRAPYRLAERGAAIATALAITACGAPKAQEATPSASFACTRLTLAPSESYRCSGSALKVYITPQPDGSVESGTSPLDKKIPNEHPLRATPPFTRIIFIEKPDCTVVVDVESYEKNTVKEDCRN
jgi:hypothetical protein